MGKHRKTKKTGENIGKQGNLVGKHRKTWETGEN